MSTTCTRCDCSNCRVRAREVVRANEKSGALENELKELEKRFKKLEKLLKRVANASREGQALLRKI